jgi:short-subunit dehydrogenase
MNADSIETRRSSLRIFVTGASGFIGCSVASAVKADGNMVRGLVRSRKKVDAVAARGVETVVGTLDDVDLLQAEARAADAVVNAASSDHRGAVEALIAGLWRRSAASWGLGSVTAWTCDVAGAAPAS